VVPSGTAIPVPAGSAEGPASARATVPGSLAPTTSDHRCTSASAAGSTPTSSGVSDCAAFNRTVAELRTTG
jgi:hypothetical protein